MIWKGEKLSVGLILFVNRMKLQILLKKYNVCSWIWILCYEYYYHAVSHKAIIKNKKNPSLIHFNFKMLLLTKINNP